MCGFGIIADGGFVSMVVVFLGAVGEITTIVGGVKSFSAT